MPSERRPVFHSNLGPVFVRLREDQRPYLNRHKAAMLAHRKGLQLTENKLLRLETGSIKHPPRDVLVDVAHLYNVDYANLVAQVVREVYGVDLSASPAPHGRSVESLDVPSSHRFAQVPTPTQAALEEELAFIKNRLGQLTAEFTAARSSGLRPSTASQADLHTSDKSRADRPPHRKAPSRRTG